MDLPSVVRRNLHVAVIRYMEQECTYQNHAQCDIYPTTLTSEVVLPSYQHFLQHIHQTWTTKKVSNESDTLGQYGRTIQMLILARVNGYYSPYSPQTIMEEEAKTLYGDVFTIAEREFFNHRLLTLFPKISEEGIETSFTFLEHQKLANGPCFVHTEQRGYQWIVFRRQPDRVPCDDKDIPETEDDPTDHEDFFSVEADEITIPADNPQYNTCIVDKIQDVSGAASSVSEIPSAKFSDGSQTKDDPPVSEYLGDSSMHSRDNNNIQSQRQKDGQKKMTDSDEELDDTQGFAY